jgi:speckle-type POZ protein
MLVVAVPAPLRPTLLAVYSCTRQHANLLVPGQIVSGIVDFSLREGIGTGKFVSSRTFAAGGRDRNIRLYPDGCKEDSAAYVSVFLCFLRGTAGVTVKLSLILLAADHLVWKHETDTRTFPSAPSDWGCSKFIEKSKLKELLRRLNRDRFTIRCVVTLLDAARSAIVVIPEPKLHHDLTGMLKNGQGADVTFSVRDQLFRAHRCILAARSPVFRAELFGAMKEKDTRCIRIDDMEPATFEGLLHFIYTDSLPAEECGDAHADNNAAMQQHLLVAADRYGLDRLRLMCEAKLCECIDVETVATSLALAEQHQCTHLKNACLGFKASPNAFCGILKTDGFKHLLASCPKLMEEILDKAAAGWSESACQWK